MGKLLKKIKNFVVNDSPLLVPADLPAFKKELAVWCNAVILRWHITDWCNYSCPYCNQHHVRKSAFDFHTPHEWIRALVDNFREQKLVVTISGGEPMLDRSNMYGFLSELLVKSFVDNVRIDTNLSWNPEAYATLPCKDKLIFMCTLHTTQTNLVDYLNRLRKLLSFGFRVGMVNYVMYGEQVSHFNSLKKTFTEFGVPLHPNPLWNSIPSEDLKRLMFDSLSELDLYYRCGGRTKGKSCIYPMLSYRMDQFGKLTVGCFPYLRGDLFKNRIPKRLEVPIACPQNSCFCLDKYSFIKGVNRNFGLNILKIYSEILCCKMKSEQVQ